MEGTLKLKGSGALEEELAIVDIPCNYFIIAGHLLCLWYHMHSTITVKIHHSINFLGFTLFSGIFLNPLRFGAILIISHFIW